MLRPDANVEVAGPTTLSAVVLMPNAKVEVAVVLVAVM
jgi:hypothetical protein